MNDENTTTQSPEAIEEEKKLAQARAELTKKLRAKGAQSISYKDYVALKAKKQTTSKTALPVPVKLILSTPILLIVCFGALFIPYMIYLIATGKPADQPKKKIRETTLEDLYNKPPATKTTIIK